MGSNVPSGGNGFLQMLVPVVVLLALVGGGGYAAYFSLSHPNESATNPALDKYVGKEFKTADRRQSIKFNSNSHGELIAHYSGVRAEQYPVKFRSYSDSPLDEFGIIFGTFNNAVWLTEHPLGFKTDKGGILYSPDTTEAVVIDEMQQLADGAQAFYNAHGHYPRDGGRDPDEIKRLHNSLSFMNPFSHQDMLPEISMLDWPSGEMPSDPKEVTPMEKSWIDGTPMSKSAEVPGCIRCVQIGWPHMGQLDYKTRSSQKIDDFSSKDTTCTEL